MKSLRPISENTTATLISQDVVDELNTKIASLNNTINNLNSELADVQAKLNVQNTTKQSGTFDTLVTKNANISNKTTTKTLEVTDSANIPSLTTVNATIHTITGDDATFDHVGAVDGTFNNLTVKNQVNTDTVVADTVQTTTSKSEKFIGGTGSFDSMSIPAASIGDLSIANNLSTPKMTLNELVTDNLKAINVEADEAIIETITGSLINANKLYTQNQVFNTDEMDVNQYIKLEVLNDADPTYIEIPAVGTGNYRIVATGTYATTGEVDDTAFSMIFYNTETAPIVHYSKSVAQDIDGIYYDTITRKWYVKTYSKATKIFWANDDKSGNNAPQTFAELPIDIDAETTLFYRAAGLNRLVIMGDGQVDYGLAVQGVLEAEVIKESASYHQLFFYGNSWNALWNFAEKYLTYEDAQGNKHYLQSETAGYLYHTSDDYRDSDSTEVEALEKIKYDGTTVTLTVDAKYGQDDIEIDGGTSESWDEDGELTEDIVTTWPSISEDEIYGYEDRDNPYENLYSNVVDEDKSNYTKLNTDLITIVNTYYEWDDTYKLYRFKEDTLLDRIGAAAFFSAQLSFGTSPLVDGSIPLEDRLPVESNDIRTAVGTGSSSTSRRFASEARWLEFRDSLVDWAVATADQYIVYTAQKTVSAFYFKVIDQEIYTQTVICSEKYYPGRNASDHVRIETIVLTDVDGNPLEYVYDTAYTEVKLPKTYRSLIRTTTIYTWNDSDHYDDNHNQPDIVAVQEDGGDIAYTPSLPLTLYVHNDAVPMEDELPFIMQFTLGSRTWDEMMNDEVFNSYAVQRS